MVSPEDDSGAERLPLARLPALPLLTKNSKNTTLCLWLYLSVSLSCVFFVRAGEGANEHVEIPLSSRVQRVDGVARSPGRPHGGEDGGRGERIFQGDERLHPGRRGGADRAGENCDPPKVDVDTPPSTRGAGIGVLRLCMPWLLDL